MLTEADLMKDVRHELGDLVEPFRDSYRGNGSQREWDLSAQNIKVDSVTARHVTFVPSDIEETPVEKTYTTDEFTLNSGSGYIKFNEPPPKDALVIVEGDSYGIFTDAELKTFIDAALSQHLLGRTVDRRYRNGHGFIKYDREEMELEDLPTEEKILVVLLATIEALWALSTDASLDIDVQTAEGTNIPRGQRWRQLQSQIDLLEGKYKNLSLMMGVGLYAPEVFNIRRVSRATNRLVPIFRPREYDEHGPPVRKKIKVNTKSDDPDGPPSPLWPSGWGH